MLNLTIRYLCLLLLVVTTPVFAEPISLSGDVESGSEDNRLSIRIKNKTSTPVEGVSLTVGEKPAFIQDVVITPSTIPTIAPRSSETFDVSFKVDPELKEDQNTTVTFKVSAVKGKLETNTATLNLDVKAQDSPDTNICWGLAEGGHLVLTDPPTATCEFYGDCEAAAAYAKQKNYFLESFGRCEVADEPSEYKLDLVEIRGPDPSKFKDATSKFSPNRAGASLSYGNDNGQGRLSYRLNDYPKSIILGKPFAFSGDLRIQDRYQAGKCQRAGLFPGASKQHKFKISGTIELAKNYSTLARVGEKKRKFVKCSKKQSTGADLGYRHGNILMDQESSFSVKCQPKKITKKTGDFINVQYLCKTKSFTGKNLDEFPLTEIYLGGYLNKSASKSNSTHVFKLYARPGFVGKDKIFIGWPSEGREVELVYTLAGMEPPLETVPYEHPFEVEGEEGVDTTGDSSVLTETDPEDYTETSSGSGQGEDLDGHPDGQESDNSQDIAQQAVREKERRRPHIEHWLRNAQPVENAQPGYHLTFDKWGRVQGKTVNGTITLNNNPAGAGTDSAEYAWTHEREKDSLNLCTLGEYVQRQLAGRETASCQKKIPPPSVDFNSVPNLVGTPANQAKTQLAELGIPIHWKPGSIPSNASQTGKVEKQNPPPGTNLKKVTRVELWVYRKAANTATVPNVVGMYFKKAAEKLKRLGLVPSMGKTFSSRSRESAGKVISQDTQSGKSVAKGATVVLNINRGGIYKVIMPDIVGLKYEEAASKLKAVGLKPLKILGSHAPRQGMVNTVAKKGLPKANQRIALGTSISLTVYNSVGNKVKPPRKIVKRDPASAFGGNQPPDSPDTPNHDWAGMWLVRGKYDMELHVSGNKVTGKYGTKMENTIEGTISGNILAGWWIEGKQRGRFENKISDDGNSWKGVWNTKDKPGGWNGGWSAKRNGKKKPPATFGKREPAPAFGGGPSTSQSNTGNRHVPDRLSCEASVAGLKTSNKKRVASIQHGEVKVRKNGIADHSCWYKTSSGEEVLVKPSFFVNRPATRLAGKKGRNLAAYCDQPAYSDVYGVGANGKAMNITIGKYSANKLTRSQLQHLVRFHTNQMARYAISCSGNTRPNSSSRSGNSGITTNRSRQKMQGGGGSNCRWDGGHDMLGIPGVEVRVYCKCNGKIVNDSRCTGAKPKGNHYYGK